MAVTIFSLIGIVCAFTGLAVFLISAIALLPVGLYNAIRACFMLKETIPLLEKETVPTVFFGATIVVALVSSGLFYMMTRIGNQGKTEGHTSFYGSTDNITPTASSSGNNAEGSILHQHRHRLFSGYTINYILIAVIWAAVGTFLVQKMVTTAENEPEEEKKVAIYILEAMKSQMSILWINLIVLGSSACVMGLSSLFFVLGRKKRNEKVSKPYFNIV